MEKGNGENLISRDSKEKITQTTNIKPMPFWQSLVFFGVPALVAALGQYVLYPFFSSLGVSYENAYHYQMLIVFIFLLIATSVAYIYEGNTLEWSSIKNRFRLHGLDQIGLKWTLGGIVTQAALSVVSTILAIRVYDFLDFTPPDIFPPGSMVNIPLMMFVLFMNVVSEELWWRGIILPRQELQHGRVTWAIHGVLWASFHAFKWWAVPFMLLTTWIVPFVSQRNKNNTPGFIIHFVINGLGLLI
jgi:membrane protease YdiL (CAAX protease family)